MRAEWSKLAGLILLFLVLLVDVAQARFLVETFRSDSSAVSSLAVADALIAGQGVAQTVSACSPVVDFSDGVLRELGSPAGRFSRDFPFPGGFLDNFAARFTASISVPEAGEYTFATNNDDGARLIIDQTVVILDDSLHAAQDFFGTVFLEAGEHSVELVYFELGGAATIELFARAGSSNSFDEGFRLVGDTTAGGLAFGAASSCPLPAVSEAERAALVALYNSTGGDGWTKNSGWRELPTRADGFNEDPCDIPTWYGVTCEQGRVTILSLFGNGLSGTLPSALGNLINLRTLYLGLNQLTGPIPPDLGNLGNLSALWLNNNRLTGSIPPELGNLGNLVILNLSNNQLKGTIPPELGQLQDMGSSGLLLSSNELEGEVPAEIANLPEGVLDIRDNRLESVEAGLDAELNQAQRGGALWNSLQEVVAVYPQLAIGGGFEVVLMISSRSGVPWRGRVFLNGGVWSEDWSWHADGADMTGESSFELTLEPYATSRTLLSSPSETALDGWLSIRAEAGSRPGDVAAAFFYNLSDGGSLSDSTGIGPSTLDTGLFFPVEQSSGSRTVLTGIAVRSVLEQVILTLWDEQGRYVKQAFLNADGAHLLGDLFPDLPAGFVGSVWADYAIPFFVTVLRVEVTDTGGVQLTSIPATPLR